MFERGVEEENAYKEALEENHVPAYIRTMLSKQKQTLKASHDEIKSLHDAAK